MKRVLLGFVGKVKDLDMFFEEKLDLEGSLKEKDPTVTAAESSPNSSI